MPTSDRLHLWQRNLGHVFMPEFRGVALPELGTQFQKAEKLGPNRFRQLR
jgi:hypothetical protein